MKKQLIGLLYVAVILLGLTACQPSTEEQLVGVWRYTNVQSAGNSTATLNGTAEINKDGSYSDNGELTVTGTTEEEGVEVKVKMGFSVRIRGTWTLSDKDLVMSPNSSGFKITYMKYYDPSDDSYLGELTGDEIKQAYSDDFVREINATLNAASTERIMMLTENKFVTESTDEDGGKSTITYNRLR